MQNFRHHRFLLFLTAALLILVLPAAALAAGEQNSLEQKLDELLKLVEENYAGDYQAADLYQGAVKGFIEGLGDPYSVYMTPEDLQSFNETTEQSFVGVGIQVEFKDGAVTVVSPIKGTPAERAGLKPGDRIIAVDGENLAGKTLEYAVQKIKGQEGTEVTLTVSRQGQQFDLAIIREKVELDVVEAKLLTPDLGYIRLATFSDRTAREFKAALDDLEARGARGYVVDLRNNPGGYLTAGLEVAAQFVPDGGTLIHIVNNQGVEQSYVSIIKPKAAPVVVLVNGGTASAAEIVAGAWRDHGAAQLVGTTTYGKGAVQTLFNLEDGSALKLTTAHYLTPNRVAIDGQGLEPDYLVTEEDQQLDRAQEVLRELVDQSLAEITLAPGKAQMLVNARQVPLQPAPYLKEGVTMVPLIPVAAALGLDATWVEEAGAMFIKGSGLPPATVKLGVLTARAGGREIELGTSPELKDGVFMAPVRFLAEAAGAQVDWDAAAQQVTLIRLIKLNSTP